MNGSREGGEGRRGEQGDIQSNMEERSGNREKKKHMYSQHPRPLNGRRKDAQERNTKQIRTTVRIIREKKMEMRGTAKREKRI